VEANNAMSARAGDNLVEARGILKHFGATEVLKGVDFSVRAGEVHALLGGNGAGKSTLIKIITGLLSRNGGDLSIAGVPRGLESHEVAASNLIAVVHQEMALLPHLTVAENIALPRLRAGWQRFDRRASREQAMRALSLIDADFAAHALDRHVLSLSLHERQLVEIARTLDSGARLLLLDEPTANLTATESERLFEAVRRLTSTTSIGVVFVSHRMREIRQIADVCSILRNGSTVVDRATLASLSDADIVERMGQGAAVRAGSVPRAGGRAAASARRLRLRCADLDLEIGAGQVLGLAGAPAGPSALIDQLVGAKRDGGWQIEDDGAAFEARSPRQALRSGVGYVSGDRANKGVLHSLPIVDNLMVSRRVLRRDAWVRTGERAASQSLIDALAIKTSQWQLPHTLSGGTQQKLLIARWTALAPKLLVLEEPTRGVDIGTKREIYAQIRAMAQAGTTVVWWSTEGVELAEVCDCVIAFDPDGRPTHALHGAEITEERLAEATGMAG
jgi:ribose transport system ATP-binding protein